VEEKSIAPGSINRLRRSAFFRTIARICVPALRRKNGANSEVLTNRRGGFWLKDAALIETLSMDAVDIGNWKTGIR